MYTFHRNVQIIISLLKQYGICDLVLSPGTRDVPLVHSIENDEFFHCYSVVDERSAAYFALGLAEMSGKPTGFCCTSSTATCNYMPAMVEAYERNIPLIALTADRDHLYLYQQEDQMIEQIGMYGDYVKKSVTLPIVHSKEEVWYSERLVNEALLELNHRGLGPVQINFEIQDKINVFNVRRLPKFWRITRVEESNDLHWKEKAGKLAKAKRILVICGQRYSLNDKLGEKLKIFAELTGAAISFEYMSNLNEPTFLKTLMATEAMNEQEFSAYVPDIVITLEAHFFSFIKYRLREHQRKFVHWRVDSEGTVCDPFCSLETIFECSSATFVDKMNNLLCGKSKIDRNYIQLWKKKINSIVFPDLQFTNFSVIHDFASILPEDSLVHLSILNSIRMFNFQNVNTKVRCYANIGADGIDGAVSTFLGQCEQESKPAFLIIGDLSFIYDINATQKMLNKNVRILLINNFAGGEFHNNFGLETFSTLNDYIAAGHSTVLKEWILSTNATYLCARNQSELDVQMIHFVFDEGNPIILEVFTNADTDSKVLKQFYSLNCVLSPKEKLLKSTKKSAKKFLRVIGKR